MTVKELEQRVAALEATVRDIQAKVAGVPTYRPITDFLGIDKDDPAAAEATRLGREWREQANRESLEEFDREDATSAGRRTSGKARS